MPWSGSRQTLVAHSACASTIGHSLRGSRWLRCVWRWIESRTAPKTSFWRWSKAPLPTLHRARPRVPGEIVAGRFGQVPTAVDPVHDLQRPVGVRLEVGDELHELVRLPVEVEVVQRLQGEGRVAHPGVAVVPVALAARGLGERGRQRGHGRAGRHVGEPLDRQRRALDRLAPAMVGHPSPADPVAPEAVRRRQPLVRLVDGARSGEALRPGERAEGLLSLLEHVAAADPVALDPERDAAGQPHRDPLGLGVGAMAIVADQGPGGRRCGRSRSRARRSARARRCRRGRGRCGPAGDRRRRRPADGCGA